jgi:hypothetical protein
VLHLTRHGALLASHASRAPSAVGWWIARFGFLNCWQPLASIYDAMEDGRTQIAELGLLCGTTRMKMSQPSFAFVVLFVDHTLVSMTTVPLTNHLCPA